MAFDLQTAQRLVTALLNLAVAVLTGASAARLWLGRDTSGWAEACRQPIRNAARVGAVVALAANLVWLWLESAAMAEVPVTEAAGAAWTMVSATHLGVAYCIGTAGLAAAVACAFVRADRHPAPPLLSLAALAVFWYTRGMVSHASGDGDFSVRLLADWVHLGLISLWVGEVVVGGAVTMKIPASLALDDRRARAAYVESLSSSATFALTGIFVTGTYAAWRSVGGWANLVGNPYGNILVAKVLVVGVAAALGGFNRFFVMPPWRACESGGAAAADVFPVRFRRILWMEGWVLLAAVMLAAWLASMPPPGEPV